MFLPHVPAELEEARKGADGADLVAEHVVPEGHAKLRLVDAHRRGDHHGDVALLTRETGLGVEVMTCKCDKMVSQLDIHCVFVCW